MAKLPVKMEVKKLGISADIANYLRSNPALKEEIDKQAKYEKKLISDRQDDHKFFIKLIHNHTHKVKDITDLPEYIHSLNVLSVPAAHDLIAKHIVPLLHHVNQLGVDHKSNLDDYSSKVHLKMDNLSSGLDKLQQRFEGLKLSPDNTETIKNIIENLESKDDFDPEAFEERLVSKLTAQLKGTSKIIQIHTGGGGLAAMPLNRIPGVNITDPQTGDTLIYNGTTKTWVNGAGGSGGTGTANVDTIIQTANGFTIGQALYYDGNTNLYALALADSADTAEVVGIVSEIETVNEFKLTLSGKITGLSGLTDTDVYFLSDVTPGLLTITIPTIVGHVVKPLLIPTGSTQGVVVNFRGQIITNSGGGGGFTSVPENSDFAVAHVNNFSRYLVTGVVTATFQTDIQADDEFIFIVRTDALFTIRLATGQVLALSPQTISSSAGTVFASKKYALLQVYANSATELQAQSVIGTWGKS